MAEIPVTKKSGIPWWVWLILALVVIAIAWWLIASGDDDAETTAVQEPVPAVESAGPITDLTTILNVADRSTLTGREVQLTGVPVGEVVGDRTFYVGSGDQRVFVVLDEVATPGQPGVEGRYDVTTGQTINLSGSVQPASAIPGEIEGLPAGADTVIRAQRLEITSRP